MAIKDEILKALELSRDKYISGQALADMLGVSRNAIWKSINLLKDEGHEIISVTNRGYRLAERSDLLSEAGIRASLAEKYRDIDIFVFSELDSTNNEAKRRVSGGLKNTALFVAETQTAGRGRLGRSFYSPKSTGLYMTLVIHPSAAFADVVSLTTAASVAVCRAVETLTDLTPQIKWVNDVYLGGKKICGILTEAISDIESQTVASMIIGIGINITTADFPAEIKGTATSLGGINATRNALAAEIANALLDIAEDLSDTEVMEYYRAHSMVIGEEIVYTRAGESFSAVAKAIDDSGGLVILKPDGSCDTLRSGEISVRVK